MYMKLYIYVCYLYSVHRLVRSNMNNIAAASLQASGTWSADFLSPTYDRNQECLNRELRGDI